jgi:hypothetical protein
MPKPSWIATYHKEHKAKPGMGEIEWRFDCFAKYVIEKGLGYPPRLVRKEKSRTDIRIVTPEGISHIVIETKIADKDLDKQKTLTQGQGYLQGGESFLVLASPSRIRIFSPKGTHISDIALTEQAVQGNALFWQLSYEYLSQKRHLEPFRRGEFDYCYIPVHTPEGFNKFIAALRLCGDLLLRFLRRAWHEQQARYQEYADKLAGLNGRRNSLETLPLSPVELQERRELLDQEERRLRARYLTPIEIFETSFPAFCQVQPYSRDVAEPQLVNIYLADITYAALNRILFVRIAEDKELLKRKISNGGIGVWRQFVTYLEDKYQDLIQLAYRDASHLYPHFFEYGIFDWYVKGDSQLNEVLESILYLLNAFDLSKVDRDTLGDLYQAYLPPQRRKELGEFYTPTEVVDYILSHVGWTGDGVLLDPACGSGGFLVRAANVLLRDMQRRNISEEARLKALPNVVGLDINPFATHIAEMNLLFLILDTYLKAKEQAEKEQLEFTLERLPVYTLDSLLGTAPGLSGGTTRNIFTPLAPVGELEEAMAARDKVGEYDYLVMNPPYVRNERLPEGPRASYRTLFQDVVSGNADIFTYFVKKDLDWLREGGRLGIIVSYGLADAAATRKLRQLLAQYTIDRVVPLEWCEVFVSNVNPMLLFLTKTHPPEDHKVAIVHGIRALKDLEQDKGDAALIPQTRWLQLAPGATWCLEVKEPDLPILEKMRAVPARLEGHYGIEMGPIAAKGAAISANPSELQNPLPLLDGREVKAWSIEWQGRFLDYRPQFIEAAKDLKFFQAPKVVLRRISLALQAAVDDGAGASFLTRNTVMLVRSPVKELQSHPFAVAALLNSLPLRYYAFLMLRAGIMEGSHRCNFYSGVIANLPIPEAAYKDAGIRKRLDRLSQQAHRIADEMVTGDKNILKDLDTLIAGQVVPFAQHPMTDLSAYFGDIDIATAQVSEDGALTGEKLGLVKGHPAILQYILSRASLEGQETLSKADFERFPVPKDIGLCTVALEHMDLWAKRKPTLSQRLRQVEAQIDDIALASFASLTADERRYIKDRASQFPMNQVLVRDEPGATTKQIPVKYWELGERYRV